MMVLLPMVVPNVSNRTRRGVGERCLGLLDYSRFQVRLCIQDTTEKRIIETTDTVTLDISAIGKS